MTGRPKKALTRLPVAVLAAARRRRAERDAAHAELYAQRAWAKEHR